MNKDVMNEGVQILLDRMDTNPEEFDDYAGKWGDIIGAVHARRDIPEAHKKDAPLPFLSDPEINALYEKLEDVRRENFTADVLRRLADAPVEVMQEDLFANVSTYSTTNVPLTKRVTRSQIKLMSEREKQNILDALEAYHDEEEKKNKKKVNAR